MNYCNKFLTGLVEAVSHIGECDIDQVTFLRCKSDSVLMNLKVPIVFFPTKLGLITKLSKIFLSHLLKTKFSMALFVPHKFWLSMSRVSSSSL